MQTNSRRILYSALVLLAVACVCAGLIIVGGAGSLFLRRAAPQQPTPVAQSSLAPLATSAPTASASVAQPTVVASPTLPQAESPSTPTALPLPAEITQNMDEIQQQVIAIRGLQPTGPVERALLTPEQLQQKINTDFFKNYTAQDAQDDQVILNALGLLPSGFDLYAFTKSVYAEQIAGYYDNETKQMYVIAPQGFLGPERMTYSHEYTHVLQDQNYNIRDGLQYSTEKCKQTSERCAGIQALIEGDATVVEQDWLRTASTEADRQQLQDFYQNYSSPVLDSAPAYLQQDMLFPYRSGQEFVQSLIDRGGWAAVNDAYHNPPQSTEQILHPDRYPDDKPISVTLPDVASILGSGWRQVRSDVLGEWYTYLMLAYSDDSNARLGASLAQNASTGWGGDRFSIWTNDQAHQTVLVLLTQWDTPDDTRQFAEAFSAYGKDRWGSPADQDGTLTWASDGLVNAFKAGTSQTLWVSAPQAATAQAILDLISVQ